MKSLHRMIVVVLLGVWCFPAVSFAKPLSPAGAEVGSRAPASAPKQPSTEKTEASALDAREKQSSDLQDFRGGAVYVYIGGGVLLVLAIILLILLL